MVGLRFRSHDLNADAFDENTTDPRPVLYELRQPDQMDICPENSLPAFLSDYAEELDPNEFMTSLRKQRRFSLSSQILAGACGAATLGVLYALVTSDTAREAFANTEASIAAIFPAPSIAAQLDPAQLPADNGQKALTPPQSSDNQAPVVASVQIAAASPTRDDIKTAYQSALQGNVPAPVAAPVAEPAATPRAETIHRLDPAEIAAALTRANALIASGDVAAARLVLRHPAESADPQAAMALAETYDPAFLQKLGVHGIVPDVAKARGWYEKAQTYGAAEAAQRLEVLASK